VSDHDDKVSGYQLGVQIGHILRKASQRHSIIFSDKMLTELTPTRFAAMVILFQEHSLSQNELGRYTAMDAATIKGVVDRLKARKLVSVDPDPDDGRRNLIQLTDQGADMVVRAIPLGVEISTKTLAPLNGAEQRKLTELLNKII